MRRVVLAWALSLPLAGCASEATPPPATPPKSQASSPKPAPPAPGHLARLDVERVLRQGPAWVFRRVMHEEVVRDDGQLVGWRLTGLPEEWVGIDVLPGDVVTRVNGIAIVMPDDAWNVWKSLARSNEVRIDLTRGGKPHTVVLPIDGAPSNDVVRALESDQPPPRVQSATDKSTVVIQGDEPPNDVEYAP